MYHLQDPAAILRKGVVSLLEIKDSDIRLLSLHQCRYAVDRAIHIGGAFSATIPMVGLYYGGILDYDVENPTATDQDVFILSKGHAVATLASIYADLGYVERSVLKNSRSLTSILNGHPGPLLPGVHIATGPMGQGIGVAQGFAIAGKRAPEFDVYALTGDGELQEGPVWEAVMYAGAARLENLCVMVDHNGGQLDNPAQLHFPYHDIAGNFESFGWRVLDVDATRMHTVYDALGDFKIAPRDGRPTAIICRSTKGFGGFSSFMNHHKASITDTLLDQEAEQQERQRAARVKTFCDIWSLARSVDGGAELADRLVETAGEMGLSVTLTDGRATDVVRQERPVRTRKAPVRDKRIRYADEELPSVEVGKSYTVDKIVEGAMRVFARDERVVSIDSDLASTSGLQAGVSFVDKARALNVGVAEANMMLIGEAFAALGANTWISTFCPFYDWKVLRRIAVGHQERLEVIEAGGWLSEGHGLDLTLLATAADLETQSNGATHMGNDDALLMSEAGHVRIVNISCPRMLLAALKWVMTGNQGIVYMRVLRSAAVAIYPPDFTFEFGRAYRPRAVESPEVTIVSSGRGVYEAIAAAEQLGSRGIEVEVVDMPTIDEEAILELYHSNRPVFVAEQNNGYIWSCIRKILFAKLDSIDTSRFIPINTTGGRDPHYIHSGTYGELAAHYGVDAAHLATSIEQTLTRVS